MYRLYHHTICPFSRKVRIHMAAKEIGLELVNENFWERRKEFIAMNPAGTIPVLFDNSNSTVICDSSVIVEYIEDDKTLWEQEPLKNLAKDNQLMAYKHTGFWQPMDTLRDKTHLEDLWQSGKAPWKVW